MAEASSQKFNYFSREGEVPPYKVFRTLPIKLVTKHPPLEAHEDDGLN